MTINHFEMELARLLLRAIHADLPSEEVVRKTTALANALQIAAPVMAQRPLAKSRPSGLSQA
jgi:hypothetical protein